MEGSASISAAPTYGATATLQYNKPALFTAGPEWITPFLATGGVDIDNVGVITLNGNKQFGNNTSIPLTIDTLATLNTVNLTNNYSLTFHGDFNSHGTLTAGTSNILISGTTT